MITRCAKRIGMILMIVPASRVTEEPLSEPWQTIQSGRVGRPRGVADQIDSNASAEDASMTFPAPLPQKASRSF
jgi:hypothetical protein